MTPGLYVWRMEQAVIDMLPADHERRRAPWLITTRMSGAPLAWARTGAEALEAAWAIIDAQRNEVPC